MKKLLIHCGILASILPAIAQNNVSQMSVASGGLIYNNGPIITNTGVGPGGSDYSLVESPNTGLGITNKYPGYAAADDFTVNATSWSLDSIVLYGSAGSVTSNTPPPTSNITGCHIQIWNGVPGASGSTVVWGDTTTNRLTKTYFANLYRYNNLSNFTRPIMKIACSTPGLTLNGGTYWIEYSFANSGVTSSFTPYITISGKLSTGNAKKRTGITWANATDAGGAQGLPFLMYGTATGSVIKHEMSMLSVVAPSSYNNLSSASTVTVSLINYGTDPETNIPVSYTINGGTAVNEVIPGPIAPQQVTKYSFTQKANLSVVGAYSIVTSVKVTGDATTSNDQATKTVNNLAFLKKVVIEEGTGTGCGWCPRGMVFMDSLRLQYPDNFIGIAVHTTLINSNEPISMDTYAKTNLGFTGIPNGKVDRSSSIGIVDPVAFKSNLIKRMTSVCPVIVDIQNINYNSSTRLLSYTLVASCVTALNGTFNFSSVLTEDSVHGTTTAYNQTNYYANNAQGLMGGWESKPSPIPAAQMYYPHVARALVDGFNGTTGSIPSSNPWGSVITKSYTITLDPAWNPAHINIVGMVINQTTKEIVNANETTIAAGPTAIGIKEEAVSSQSSFVVYPVPSQGKIMVQAETAVNIIAINLLGETVKVEKNTNSIDLSNVPKGTYFLIIDNGKKTETKKVILTE
jgi:hypothetical protein